MTLARICIAFAVIVAPCNFLGQAAAQSNRSDIDTADRMFEGGKFAEAGELYARVAGKDGKDYLANLQLGRIALLSNRLDDAKTWLEKAVDIRPSEPDPKVMLAEVYYRRDEFESAAAALNGVDVSANPLILSQYPP
jgi:predicted Zn-dependent protease